VSSELTKPRGHYDSRGSSAGHRRRPLASQWDYSTIFSNRSLTRAEKGLPRAPRKPEIEGSSETRAMFTTAGRCAEAPQFLAPKNYVPRSSVQVVPPTRGQPHPERKARFSGAGCWPQMAKEIVLTLGDVLSRIPSHFLRQSMPTFAVNCAFLPKDSQPTLRGVAPRFRSRTSSCNARVFVTDAEGSRCSNSAAVAKAR
jgi:hypothetical protein